MDTVGIDGNLTTNRCTVDGNVFVKRDLHAIGVCLGGDIVIACYRNTATQFFDIGGATVCREGQPFGVNDVFGESGPAKELLHKYELDAEGIANRILREMK